MYVTSKVKVSQEKKIYTQWKKETKNEKNEKYEKEKKIWVCVRWTPRFSKSAFKASSLKDPFSFSNHVQSDNEDFLCVSGSLFAICTCPLI
jgi:hypothetical protein